MHASLVVIMQILAVDVDLAFVCRIIYESKPKRTSCTRCETEDRLDDVYHSLLCLILREA